MRTISSTRSASPSMSGRQVGASATTSPSVPAMVKPSASRIASCSSTGMSTPASVFTRSRRSGTARLRIGGAPAMHELRGFAAAEFQDHARGDLRAGLDEGRIDAALEAIARIGIDAELAAGRGGADRIEIGRFEEDVRGFRRAAGRRAADDAGDADRAAIVGDHRHSGIERVGLAVERLDASRRRAPAARGSCPSPCRRRRHAAAAHRHR